MAKFRGKQDFKQAMAAAAKTFAGDEGVILGYSSTETATDCGKAVAIRDPDFLINKGLAQDEAEVTSRSSTAHEAAHLKYGTDVVVFNDKLVKAIRRGADRELAFSSLNFAEDLRVDQRMGEERPGYLEQRRQSVAVLARKTYTRHPTDRRWDLRTIVLCKSVGVDLDWEVTPDEQERIDKAVKLYSRCPGATSTAETAEIGWQVYVVLYGEPTPPAVDPAPPPPPKEESMPSFGKSDYDDDGTLDSIKLGDEDEEEEDEEDIDLGDEEEEELGDEDADEEEADGEPSPGSRSRGSRPDSDDPDDDYLDDAGDSGGADPLGDKPYDPGPEKDDDLEAWLKSKEGELKSGDSMADGLSDGDVKDKLRRDDALLRGDARLAKKQEEEHKRDKRASYEHTDLSAEIEAMYSNGINAGVQIWYRKSRYISVDAGVRAIRRLSKGVPAAISELTSAFKDVLRKARERDTYLHRSGTIRADKVWRGSVLGDGRVFTRHEYKGAGGYAVKLLLDASGSMSGRDTQAGIVAYVIAKALKEAGMAVAVEQFDAGTSSCCVYHSFLLPWDSNDVERVFAYRADEQNRDGYSIKAAGHELLKRQEDHKIMLVLSDGAPCHGGHSDAIEIAGGNPYGSGQEFNDDAAKAVRDLRTKGVKVLGIYFGGSYSKDTEAYIYGKDFVHITEIERMAEQVKRYLIRTILQGG